LHHHYIFERIEAGEIDVTYISTNEQEANIMTMPLGKAKFEVFRYKIGLHSVQEKLKIVVQLINSKIYLFFCGKV
jgi:hypothetical protein